MFNNAFYQVQLTYRNSMKVITSHIAIYFHWNVITWQTGLCSNSQHTCNEQHLTSNNCSYLNIQSTILYTMCTFNSHYPLLNTISIHMHHSTAFLEHTWITYCIKLSVGTSFLRHAEFWAKLRNLPVSAEFLHFCGIFRTRYWPVIRRQNSILWSCYREPYCMYTWFRHKVL